MDYNTCSPDPTIPTPYNNQLAPRLFGHCRDDNTIYGLGEALYNEDFPTLGSVEGNMVVPKLNRYFFWLA